MGAGWSRSATLRIRHQIAEGRARIAGEHGGDPMVPRIAMMRVLQKP
jgi:hypothetical protein